MIGKVSVIIPTKNRIEATFRCLKSVVEQSLKPFEIIVVDDGSVDKIEEQIRAKYPQVLILRNETSRGGAVARNQGADLATGEYIAFLDSDDEWLNSHLQDKLNLLKFDNSDGAFGTFILQKGQEENPISFKADFKTNGNIGNSILSEIRFDARTSTFVFKREAFLKVKFDENLKKHQDWDLAINFHKEYKLSQDHQPTVRIYVEQEEERMSQKLQHPSSFYFIDKNSKFLDSNNIFMFCAKQIMRSQLAKEPKVIIDRYLSIAGSHYNNLNMRNKLMLFLMKQGILDLGAVYKLARKIRS